ncbi:hypothetical protein [Streptomyces griseorubiginosus]|uniref:hypothetical protein n=1 Tax=Streptomyces griseorubiginosus TaxID=67304 RepID=UPI001FCC3FD7|nr:hypothetical protein [Streptomyces griseorubiginosus]
MSNQQYPPQPPGWGGPQQPYGQPPFPPQPPKKTGVGRILGFGCLGIVGLVVVIGVVAAVLGGGSGSKNSSGSGRAKATDSASTGGKPAGDTGTSSGQKTGDTRKTGGKVVTFKVWGTAPAGALGPLDISYGSDSDTRKGTFKNGEFEATLPLHKDAMYYTVTAQLQGSGDINCSVTVDGHTKKGHASGGYNICDAQLSSGFLGGWN